ncbi:MAG: type IV pilus assembly PilZ [Marinobacter sp. T13-3]|jgi:hypothetical protein|nr:MAG: type IV pilus assembly PilZ [Marinobacter sp. T13-3]
MQDYAEKRDFHRMRVDAHIQITDSKGESVIGTCRDLSATGMQLSVSRPFEAGEMIKTRMESAGSQTAALETECEVIRCEPDGDGYLLGVTIDKVTQ